MRERDINDFTEAAVRERLLELVEWLDEQDQDDTFGTEGWRHAIGWED